jgi:hypothetical protein
MFLFALLPGHGRAICQSNDLECLTNWEFQSPLIFSNIDALLGESVYKPFIVMDDYKPNKAAKINEQYCLLVVTNHKAKFIVILRRFYA